MPPEVADVAKCRTPHGVRGLKSYDRAVASVVFGGRTPHGVRGLKCHHRDDQAPCSRSHPSRGAWIEIPAPWAAMPPAPSRTPHGVRGLK